MTMADQYIYIYTCLDPEGVLKQSQNAGSAASLTFKSLKAIYVQGFPTNPQVSAKQREKPKRNLGIWHRVP